MHIEDDSLITLIRTALDAQTQVLSEKIGRVSDSVQALDLRITDRVEKSEKVSEGNADKLDSLTKKVYFALGGGALLDGVLHFLTGKK